MVRPCAGQKWCGPKVDGPKVDWAKSRRATSGHCLTTRLESPTIFAFVRFRQPNSLSSICHFHFTLLSFIFFLVFLIFPVGSHCHVVSILSRVFLQISSAVLTKLSCACFPPSLGTTLFRHETIPVCAHHSSSF